MGFSNSFTASDLTTSLLDDQPDTIESDTIVYQFSSTPKQHSAESKSKKKKSSAKKKSTGSQSKYPDEEHSEAPAIEMHVSSSRKKYANQEITPPQDVVAITMPTEESQETASQDDDEDDKVIHNYFIYGAVLLYFAPAAMFGEGTFAYYCYYNAKKGIEIYARVITGDADPKELDNYRYYIKYIIGYISFYSEFVNGCTQFSITSVAKKIDNIFHHAPIASIPKMLFLALYQTPVYSLYSAALWGLFWFGALGTAWGDLDEVYEQWMDSLGDILGSILLVTLFNGAISYVALSFAERTAAGIRSWWDNPTRDLWKRLKNHRSPAVEAQYFLENSLTMFARIISISYLWGGLAEKVKFINVPKAVGHTIGAFGGAGQTIGLFWFGTFAKYHMYTSPSLIKAKNIEDNENIAKENKKIRKENKKNPHAKKNIKPKIPLPKPVSQEERDMAIKAHNAELSYCQRLLEEIKRPLFIGYANMGFAFCATKFWIGDNVAYPVLTTAMSDWTASAIIYTGAFLATLPAYYPYYKADKYRHANAWVIEKRNAIEHALAPLPTPELKWEAEANHSQSDDDTFFITDEALNVMNADYQREEATLTQALKDICVLSDLHKKHNAALQKLEEAKESFVVLKQQPLYNQFADVLKNRIGNQINGQDADKNEDLIAWFLGASASFGMVTCRIAILLATMVNNESLGPLFSPLTWVIICTYAGIVVGDNRYQTMTPESIKSIKDLGKSAKNFGSWVVQSGSRCFNGMHGFFHSNQEAPKTVESNEANAGQNQQPYTLME